MQRSMLRPAVAVLIALSLLLVACSKPSEPAPAPAPAPAPSDSSGGGTPAPADPLQAVKDAVKGKKLVVGFSSSPTLLDVVGVKTVQILKDEFGVNAEYKSLEASTMAAAVQSGDLDIAEVSLSRLAAWKLGGGEPYIFGSNDIKNDYVVVAKTEIQKPEDMKGKVWGNPSDAGLTVVIRNGFFEKAGLDYQKDVRAILTGSSSATLQALPAGQIDAGLLHPDQAATLIEQNPGKFHVLYYTYEAVQLINDVWYTKQDWAKANPDLVQAFSLASIMAARWAYADRDGWIKLGKEYVPKFSDKVIADTYDVLAGKIQLWDANGGVDMAACEAAIQLSLDTGALEEPVKCSEIMSTGPQEKSLEILGKH